MLILSSDSQLILSCGGGSGVFYLDCAALIFCGRVVTGAFPLFREGVLLL